MPDFSIICSIINCIKKYKSTVSLISYLYSKHKCLSIENNQYNINENTYNLNEEIL